MGSSDVRLATWPPGHMVIREKKNHVCSNQYTMRELDGTTLLEVVGGFRDYTTLLEVVGGFRDYMKPTH